MKVLLAFVKIKSYNDSLGERHCAGKTEDMYLLCKIEVNSGANFVIGCFI